MLGAYRWLNPTEIAMKLHKGASRQFMGSSKKSHFQVEKAEYGIAAVKFWSFGAMLCLTPTPHPYGPYCNICAFRETFQYLEANVSGQNKVHSLSSHSITIMHLALTQMQNTSNASEGKFHKSSNGSH